MVKVLQESKSKTAIMMYLTVLKVTSLSLAFLMQLTPNSDESALVKPMVKLSDSVDGQITMSQTLP
jgi:hypothetical protein